MDLGYIAIIACNCKPQVLRTTLPCWSKVRHVQRERESRKLIRTTFTTITFLNWGSPCWLKSHSIINTLNNPAQCPYKIPHQNLIVFSSETNNASNACYAHIYAPILVFPVNASPNIKKPHSCILFSMNELKDLAWESASTSRKPTIKLSFFRFFHISPSHSQSPDMP